MWENRDKSVKNVNQRPFRCTPRSAIMVVTMFHRFYQLLVSSVVVMGLSVPCPAQQAKDSKSPQTKQQKESEPPEEDDAAKPKEYAFNPLQAEHELRVGEFYMKKGSYAAAVARFTEATKWNPTLAEAYLRLGEA